MLILPTDIRDIALAHAKETVKAMSIAQRMGMMNGEEDLTQLVAAGIETALEELISKNTNQTTENGK